jgi:hypothetical protein
VDRFRLITKFRLARRVRRSLLAEGMLGLRYVLFDPELESHTYELANTDEIASMLAEAFSASESDARKYMEEGAEDPDLSTALNRRVRWRLDSKRRLPLGNRAVWYAIVRLAKPGLVVETGIRSGLGSLALLCALRRNAAEGHDGELISVDRDPTAGWLVPSHLRPLWSQLVGTGTEVLPAALSGRTVGCFIHDTVHSYENQRDEFAIAVEHADDPVVLLDSGGGQTAALEEICRASGVDSRTVKVVAQRHFFKPGDIDMAILPQRGS